MCTHKCASGLEEYWSLVQARGSNLIRRAMLCASDQSEARMAPTCTSCSPGIDVAQEEQEP